MFFRKCAFLAGVTMMGLLPADAAQLGGNPGPIFDMPGPGDYYFWDQSMSGLAVDDTLLAFTVMVPSGGSFLSTFQVFGGCDGSNVYSAGFSLFVGGIATDWTSATRGDGAGCGYHDFLDQVLDEGNLEFRVVFDGADNAPPAGANFADVRFGDTFPAVPLPATGFLVIGALAALAGLRRRSARHV